MFNFLSEVCKVAFLIKKYKQNALLQRLPKNMIDLKQLGLHIDIIIKASVLSVLLKNTAKEIFF